MTSISTIIPVYNASGTIKRCLDSLLDAQVPDVLNEIIIVNDGSTDNTLKDYACHRGASLSDWDLRRVVGVIKDLARYMAPIRSLSKIEKEIGVS